MLCCRDLLSRQAGHWKVSNLFTPYAGGKTDEFRAIIRSTGDKPGL